MIEGASDDVRRMYHDNILKNIAPSTFNYWELTNSASIYFSLVVEKKIRYELFNRKTCKRNIL